MRRTLIMLALLGAPAGAWAQAPTCTDVQVGGAQSYTCLNAQLQAQAKAAHGDQPLDTPAITANSPSNVVGTFNESATRERLGTNFGKSVTPSRPAFNPPPVLGAPR